MNNNIIKIRNLKVKNKLSLFAGLFGVFLTNLPSAFAVPTKRVSDTNLCPGIYYEEPYNSRLIVPRKCAPNAATLRWLKGNPVPKQPFLELSEDTEVTPLQPRVSENSSDTMRSQSPDPIAVVNPKEGKVNIKLRNDTNTRIAYQVIEHTKRRYIPAGQEITLQDLPAPVTITMLREDRGFIKVNPMSKISESGMLSLSLDESKKFNDNQGVLRIKKDGQVFLN